MDTLIQPIFQEILNTASDLIFVFDENGKILFVNNAWKNTLGYTQKDIENLSLEKITAVGYKLRTGVATIQAERYGVCQDFHTVLIAKNKRKVTLMGSIYCKLPETEDEPLIFRAMLSNKTEKLRAETLQNLYYKISKLIESGVGLPELYSKLYQELEQILPIDSFIVGIFDEKRASVQYPFYVSSVYSQEQGVQGEKFIEYAAFTFERPMFLYEEYIKEICRKHSIKLLFPPAKVWLGVPLVIDKKHIGILILQSFRKREDYSKRDLEILQFISSQLASAVLRYQNEEKIRAQAARLKAIFESGSHLMWSLDRNGNLTSFNENFKKLLNSLYRIENLENGVNLLKIIGKERSHQEVLLKWIHHYRLAFADLAQQFEFKFVRETQKESWWEVYLNPIYDRNGQVAEVSAVAHDITQKKITELILAESELKFRSIFESFQDVYFRTNIEGVINMVSPSVSELLGEPPSEVIGRNILSFVASDVNVEELMKQLFTLGNVRNYESAVRLADGTIKNVISNFRLIYDEKGQLAGVEGVARDITELKSAIEQIRLAKEEAERSLEVKKRFLSNMSHEIRTPMNGIIGMLELLNNSELSATQQEYVKTIRTSSETLLNILNDILDLSKIEAGKMEVRARSVCLRETLDKLIALFRQRALEQDTEMYYEMEHSIPSFILTDETRLLQILSNLTSNAIKFTQNGKVIIRVRLQLAEPPQIKLRFEVEDTGLGISPEKLNLLFKQFSQLHHDTYTKAQSGTGLGLAISKELVELLGGEIGVVSEEGKGSTFWFTILTQEASPEQTTVKEQVKPNIVFSHHPSVLIVDDNVVNLRVAEGMLVQAGCKVFTASSGQKAIDLLSAVHFDIVFMDIQMPHMDGIEATQRIKSMKLPICPPIIAMTAFSMVEEREMFLKAGMDDYIAKPITQEAILEKVEKWTQPQQLYLSQNVSSVISLGDAVLDKQIFENMQKYGDQEFVRGIYEDFMRESEQIVVEIRELLRSTDDSRLKSLLHSLKGTAATLGAQRIAQCAATWEHLIRSGQNYKIESQYKHLYYELMSFKSHLAYVLAHQ
ncbi:MAG: PAS domain S-box protein [Cytophagales bacterium]|nr:PAS domain S-box protein [Cytophagales bacterium]MDW8384704.1 PAS domain S-box protein [Flammeovirgaceae bacterium]